MAEEKPSSADLPSGHTVVTWTRHEFPGAPAECLEDLFRAWIETWKDAPDEDLVREVRDVFFFGASAALNLIGRSFPDGIAWMPAPVGKRLGDLMAEAARQRGEKKDGPEETQIR